MKLTPATLTAFHIRRAGHWLEKAAKAAIAGNTEAANLWAQHAQECLADALKTTSTIEVEAV